MLIKVVTYFRTFCTCTPKYAREVADDKFSGFYVGVYNVQMKLANLCIDTIGKQNYIW